VVLVFKVSVIRESSIGQKCPQSSLRSDNNLLRLPQILCFVPFRILHFPRLSRDFRAKMEDLIPKLSGYFSDTIYFLSCLLFKDLPLFTGAYGLLCVWV
jgi:hypothetical protein